jgi:ATP-dependent Lon protease
VETFEQKALDVFSEIVINKSFVHKAGFGSRAIPTYVREWIISHYLEDGTELTEGSRQKIAAFVQRFVPDKSQREALKNLLYEQMEVQLLDNFSVYVNLDKGDRYLNIPYMDENGAFAQPQIIQDNEMLLSSGLWGVGTLFYIPKNEDSPKGQVWMREFKPFQLANMDLEYFRECRKSFSTQEWIDFLISSMGFNHNLYSVRQKILLISRLIPMVEPRYNLVELAPKGTGKSFVFENMSRYVAVRSGAVSPAVLFFNDSRKTPGLITRYDCVVIDEAQKVKGDTSGELTALLKSYLEAGRFARGSASSINAEAGLVMLANIELDHNKRPLNEQIGLFRVFPNFLRETAFIDRFSGLLPGWDLPRISKDTPAKTIGLKGDIFGEILHSLRSDITFRDYVKANMELIDCDDMRDSKAVEAGAAGLLKILFPDKDPSEDDFYYYCVNPALELRQRIRDELCILDREYLPIMFKSKYPDAFQLGHHIPAFVSEENLDKSEFIVELAAQPVPEPETEIIVPLFTEKIEVIEEVPAEDSSEKQKLNAKTLHIEEGETGYSFEKIFGPYLKGSKRIVIVDPYIRFEYQIRNFLAFANIIDTSHGVVEVHLTTSADDADQAMELLLKYKEIADSLGKNKIKFTYEFNPSIHDRSIRCDNGWSIFPGRGFDIFQKPESRYELSEVNQLRRKCKESEIVFIHEEQQ